MCETAENLNAINSSILNHISLIFIPTRSFDDFSKFTYDGPENSIIQKNVIYYFPKPDFTFCQSSLREHAALTLRDIIRHGTIQNNGCHDQKKTNKI